MIAIIDVGYSETQALAAAVIIENWTDPKPTKEYQIIIEPINEYISGEFYKRELPCILQLLATIEEDLSFIVVDGYVWLNNDKKPGLGAYLYEVMHGTLPIMGVAKNAFKQENQYAAEIYRGNSRKALYVTCEGMPIESAVNYIQNMTGSYRIPDVLKRVDQLSRDWEMSLITSLPKHEK